MSEERGMSKKMLALVILGMPLAAGFLLGFNVGGILTLRSCIPPREVPPARMMSALSVSQDWNEVFAVRKGGDIVLRGKVIGHDGEVASVIWDVIGRETAWPASIQATRITALSLTRIGESPTIDAETLLLPLVAPSPGCECTEEDRAGGRTIPL